jgi:hypothetical protein
MQRVLRSVVLAASLLAVSAAARAETTDCTEIPSVPHNITAPGVYCLKKSLELPLQQGVAITILANDVVVDFNGHVLENFPGAAGIGWGIYALNVRHVTLRNGAIRGFSIGVNLEDRSGNSMGHLVERLVLDGNTLAGLSVDGRNSVVRNNRVMRTGAAGHTYGIFARGAGIQVTGNVVTELVEAAGGVAVGITAYEARGGVVERNVVSNFAFGPAQSVGIEVTHAGNVAVVGNRIANMRTGILIPKGNTSVYMDNTVGGAATPFSGGTAAGATNFTF